MSLVVRSSLKEKNTQKMCVAIATVPFEANIG